MKKNRQKSFWILDAVLFAGFLICLTLDLTGLSLHQWLGVIGGVLTLVHLVLHWDWVAVVTRRFFGKTCGQARTYYVLDVSIMLGFYVIVVTGIFMSTWLNLEITHYSTWKDFHETVSLVTLGLLVLKIALHGRWIVCTARRSFTRRVPAPMPAVVPAVASSGMSRREFLKLMGIVSAASLAAVAFTLDKQ